MVLFSDILEDGEDMSLPTSLIDDMVAVLCDNRSNKTSYRSILSLVVYNKRLKRVNLSINS